MTQTAIQKQVAAIHRATSEAVKSPEKARAFLAEAGIITQAAIKNKATTKKKK